MGIRASRAMISSASVWRFGVGGSNGGTISRSSSIRQVCQRMVDQTLGTREALAASATFKRIILRNNSVWLLQLLLSQFTSFFALLIASPGYFSGAIQLGVLIQTAHAFERVNEALSWFIGSYTAFAQWRATVDRLTEFAAEINREADTAVLARARKRPCKTRSTCTMWACLCPMEHRCSPL